MQASVCVGRVGGLALALGIGAAVGGLGSGAAAASPAESADSSATAEQPVLRNRASAPSSRSQAARSAASQSSAGDDSGRSNGFRRQAATSTGEKVRADSGTVAAALPTEAAVRPASVSAEVVADRLVQSTAAAPTKVLPTVNPDATPALAAPESAPEQPVIAAAVPAAGRLDTAVEDSTGSVPVGPVGSAVSWAMVGAARRDTGNRPALRTAAAGRSAAALPLDSESVPAAAAAVNGANTIQSLLPAAAEAAIDPIAAIFQQIQSVISGVLGAVVQFVNQVGTVVNQFVTAIVNIFVPTVPVNSVPTVSTPSFGATDPLTGAITGTIAATDADADTLAYTAPATTAKGAVTIDAATGAFTYTPTVTARQNAAKVGATEADKSDAFTVTVSDNRGASVPVVITVPISPLMSAPNAGAPTLGVPDASTGVVTGKVNASDADGDSLTYTAPATTGKGSVTIDANTGVFTYTPTLAARHDAARVGAEAAALVDTFTVTVSDGRGGATEVPVNVAITGFNTTPTGGAVMLGQPNPNLDQASFDKGTVTGVIKAVDADGDALTYSGSAMTPKGSVVVNADGSFTYTPNAAARNNFGTVVIPPRRGVGPDFIAPPDYTRAYFVDVAVPNGRWLSTVSIVDISSNSIIQAISFDRLALQGLVISPDGAHTYLVTNTSSVVDVDLDTGTVIATIPTPFNPRGIVFSADSSRAYVTTASGIVSIDTTTHAAVTIDSPLVYTKLVVSPDGSRVYGSSNSGLLVFDTASNTLMTTIGTSSSGFALSPDGTKIYVSNGDGIQVISPVNNSVARTIPVTGDGVRVVAADDPYIYVVNTDPTSPFRTAVSMIDATTGKVVATVDKPVGSYLYDFTVRPGSGLGVYAKLSNMQASGVWMFIPFDPAANQARVDSFTVTVTDGHGGTATVPISVPVH